MKLTHFIVGLPILVVGIAFGYGWLHNIIDLVTAEHMQASELVGRIIGIFIAPVGAVMGYF